MSQAWEYKVVWLSGGTDFYGEKLNPLGREGWEMVGFHSEPRSVNLSVLAIFKRPLVGHTANTETDE